MSEQPARLRLHDAIDTAFHDPEVNRDRYEHFLLSRWIVIGELILPNGAMGLMTIASTADGRDLTSWDQYGLIGITLRRINAPPPTR